MSFVYCNPNPVRKTAGDCVVRGIAIIEDLTWDEAYDLISDHAKKHYDMPSANWIVNSLLYSLGYVMIGLPSSCPHCYTVSDFADDHPSGIYLLGTGSHVVAVIHGDYYDTWNSGEEVPIYYWKKQNGGISK